MQKIRGEDWSAVGWPYRRLHTLVSLAQNRAWLRARGIENVPATGGVVLAANHASAWDPVALGCSLGRPIGWLAKKELMESRLGAWFFPAAGCIRVDRDTKNPEAFAYATRALREGRIVGVFPQATRRATGGLGPAKTGAARLAIETGAPVVPAGVASERFWPRGKSLPRVTQRVYVAYGAPMTLSGDAADETTRVMDEIARLLAEAQAARDAKAPWTIP